MEETLWHMVGKLDNPADIFLREKSLVISYKDEQRTDVTFFVTQFNKRNYDNIVCEIDDTYNQYALSIKVGRDNPLIIVDLPLKEFDINRLKAVDGESISAVFNVGGKEYPLNKQMAFHLIVDDVGGGGFIDQNDN